MSNNFWGVQSGSTQENSPPQSDASNPNTQSNSTSPLIPTASPIIDLSKIKIPNIYPTEDGKFRVYITANRKTKYIGTFDSLEDAINARAAYVFDGTLPESRKERAARQANEVLAFIQAQKKQAEVHAALPIVIDPAQEQENEPT